MNVLFVAHGDFFSNSSVHIFGFANHLTRLGHNCAVAVPSGKAMVTNIGDPLFKIFDFEEYKEDLFRPDVIHCWTPREHVRTFSERVRKQFNCKLIVHLEDNEELISERISGIPFNTLKTYNDETLKSKLPPQLSHPRNYKRFLDSADAVTIIIEPLKTFAPDKPTHLLWPGVETGLFSSQTAASRHPALVSLAHDERVIAYTGNVHAANANEVLNLYLAVDILNRQGLPTRIIRTGADHQNFLNGHPDLKKYELSLGVINWREIPAVLARADLLIQPGRDDDFNRFRLPSKLPEYLAMGKPVLLPISNIGQYMADGQNAVILHTGHPEEIAAAADFLLTDASLSKGIGESGRRFAIKAFDWERNTASLLQFYDETLSGKFSNYCNSKMSHISAFQDESTNVDNIQSSLVRLKWQAAIEAEAASFTKLHQELQDELNETTLQMQHIRHSFYGRMIRLMLRANSTGFFNTLGWLIGRCTGKRDTLTNDPFEKLARLNEKLKRHKS